MNSVLEDSKSAKNEPKINASLLNKPQTILLVDDEPTVVALVRTVLNREGYYVLETVDAEAAVQLSIAPGKAPDLLLTDVTMPTLSGPDLARAVQNASPSTRILFMTAHNAALDREHGIPPDADVLRKPFRVRELVERVRLALSVRATAVAC